MDLGLSQIRRARPGIENILIPDAAQEVSNCSILWRLDINKCILPIHDPFATIYQLLRMSVYGVAYLCIYLAIYM